MAKFSNPPLPSRSPLTTTAQALATHEGGAGWTRDPKSELFVLAVTEMAEDTFYESAPERHARMTALVRQVVATDPTWIARFAPWLRTKANMRSASIMLATEFAVCAPGLGRPVISSVCQRPDEPAEVLGYYLATRGRKLPAGVKRGIADAASRLYTQWAALKYDGESRGIRMADVIELTHPKPANFEQSALFRYLLDRRHNRPEDPPPVLAALRVDHIFQHMSVNERRAAWRVGDVPEEWSWERLAGWLPGGMDAAAWESVIPRMGYMALLRNLRNFEQAGVSEDVLQTVAMRIADPEAVATSKQFPYRFWNAFQAAPSARWAFPLEKALDLSCSNLPDLPGRSLLLIDTSGSMQSPVGGARSQAMRYEVAALFAGALSKHSEKSDIAIFAQTSKSFPIIATESILRYIVRVHHAIGVVGHATFVHGAIQRHYAGHDRVIVLTDEQGQDNYMRGLPIPNIHVVNLAGYRSAMMPSERGRYTYAGFTDAMFSLMPLLEAGQAGTWPWEG